MQKHFAHSPRSREKELLAPAGRLSLPCSRCLRNRAVALVPFGDCEEIILSRNCRSIYFQISGGEGTLNLYIVGNGEEEKEEEEESGEEVNGGAFKDSRERSFASVVEEEDPWSFACTLWGGVGWSGRDGGVYACACVMGAARKMVVEVTSARGLMRKDGQGSANPYCVLDYDGQRKRTKVKTKDLDPNWNEKVLKHRYERLRGVAGRLQNALGELATTGERLHSLLSWRDPRATEIFVTFCLVTAIFLYVTPFQAVAVLLGVYVLRHPRFRDPLPAIPINFFNRLPSQSDRIL